MAMDNVQDPLLQSMLAAAERTREQCLITIDFLNEHPLHGPDSEAQAETARQLSKHQKLMTSRLANYRGLHRDAVLASRGTKQETAEAKSEIDTLHLQLQNLLYEQRHLDSEIAGCRDYNHVYTSLDLVPETEFLASNTDIDMQPLDQNSLMLARIRDEHSRRQLLDTQRSALVDTKQSLIKANKAQKDQLDTLDAEIAKFVAAGTHIQTLLDAKTVESDTIMQEVDAT